MLLNLYKVLGEKGRKSYSLKNVFMQMHDIELLGHAMQC